MDIQGKVALITGSSHRVGKSIALNLAQKGAKIVVHYLSQRRKAEETSEEINSIGNESLVIQGDISTRSDWLKMKETIVGKWGQIHILINNAAIFYRSPFFEISDQNWNQFMDINLKGTFYGCQIIGEHMYQKGEGKIINIADVSAETVWPNYIPYCISKAGIISLSKGLAKTLAPHVTVNVVAPGTVLLAESYDEDEENYYTILGKK